MKSRLAFLQQQVVPTLLCFGVAWALAQTDGMERVENLTLDFRTRLRAHHQPPPDRRVAVIGVDDDSLGRFGRWPWRRQWHAQLLQSLALAPSPPAVVGWDILFTEPNPDDVLLEQGALALPGAVIFAAYSTDAIEAAEPVAAGNELAPDLTQPLTRIEGDASKLYSAPAALLPVAPLRSVALTAFVDTPPASDGVRRSVPLLVRVKDRVYPSLPLQALLRFWQLTVADARVVPGDAIYLEGRAERWRIPIDDTGGYLVNYRYAIRDLEVHGHAKITEGFTSKYARQAGEAGEPAVDLPDLGGKILLVGQVADGLTDMGPSPFSPLTPLVFVHANAIDNILRGDYARRAPPSIVWPAAMLVGVLGLARFSQRKMLAQALFSLGVPALFLGAAVFAWSVYSLAIPVAAPLLGFGSLQVFMIARRVLAEQRAKEEIKGMFGTYVSPALVKRLLETAQKPRLGGHEENITAYFSDIQGFSSFSELLPADRLVELMNEYLTACTDIITEEGGTLDKYVGDAVVAMFGAPIALPDHAYRACVVSQRVQLKLGELRAKWKAEGDHWPEIVWNMQSRIGLNTGPCIIGNMGSRTRFNYTMMGDNVNLAARMESGAKCWGVHSMCTEATKVACERHGGDRVVFRSLGQMVVVGRSLPVPVFEIVGLRENVTAAVRECIRVFETGLARYHARDWVGATAQFQRSAGLEPNQPGEVPGVTSNPSLAYLKLAQHHHAAPPSENWDGVHVMTDK